MEKNIEAKLTLKIKLPSVPNFILLAGDSNTSISVAEFSDEELKKIGELWTAELIKNAEKKRLIKS